MLYCPAYNITNLFMLGIFFITLITSHQVKVKGCDVLKKKYPWCSRRTQMIYILEGLAFAIYLALANLFSLTSFGSLSGGIASGILEFTVMNTPSSRQDHRRSICRGCHLLKEFSIRRAITIKVITGR
jgi:hypothetical protein